MKSLTAFFLIGLVIFSNYGAKNTGVKDVELMGISVESGIFDSKDWQESLGSYREAIVPDADTAIEIAESIIHGIARNMNGFGNNFYVSSVFYDEPDKIWVVGFLEKDDNTGELILGGGCSIAIKMADGQVLRLWFGE